MTAIFFHASARQLLISVPSRLRRICLVRFPRCYVFFFPLSVFSLFLSSEHAVTRAIGFRASEGSEGIRGRVSINSAPRRPLRSPARTGGMSL